MKEIGDFAANLYIDEDTVAHTETKNSQQLMISGFARFYSFIFTFGWKIEIIAQVFHSIYQTDERLKSEIKKKLKDNKAFEIDSLIKKKLQNSLDGKNPELLCSHLTNLVYIKDRLRFEAKMKSKVVTRSSEETQKKLLNFYVLDLSILLLKSIDSSETKEN